MPLFGFADLHAHPSSHLAFGALRREDGGSEFGIFWGSPGTSLREVNLAKDLPPCDGTIHTVPGSDNGGPVGSGVRAAVMDQLNGLTGHRHLPSGWRDFAGWPHARSLMHQQMHISWIRRAWQGGLRLMFACVTDNQTLSMLWHRWYNKPPTPFDPDFDFRSARDQLTFLRELAAANASWMTIVTTPAEARAAIHDDKLALVLSLEMDSLTVEQIVALKDEFGVRHVVPIHLADNSFGGVAVYSPIFNTNNHYLRGEFYRVASPGDPDIGFQLSRPRFLEYVSKERDAIEGGKYVPTAISDAEFAALGYPTTGGHKNSKGLDRPYLELLMRQGLLIDLAHMSEASMEDALTLSETHGYPLMNSHTGLRNPLRPRGDTRPTASERGMLAAHVLRMAAQGGIFGLGTSREDMPVEDPMGTWLEEYTSALLLMGNTRVAIGTDMNGFAPQIPFSSSLRRDRITPIALSYPLSLPHRMVEHLGVGRAAPLDQMTAGTKTFDFKDHGLAHYGMLPEFLQAAHELLTELQSASYADERFAKLYTSAEQVVEMWERVETVAREMRRPAGRPGTVPLDTYWKAKERGGDNRAVATDAGRREAEADGYQFIRTEGFIFSTADSRTGPLSLFKSGAPRHDSFSTATDAGRSDARLAGYTEVRDEGFVLSVPEKGSVPLNLYWSDDRTAYGDNFVTASEAGRREAAEGPYRLVRTEGYVFPRAIALRAADGRYLRAANGGGAGLYAQVTSIGDYETFEVVYLADEKIALRTHAGYYVCAESGGGREMIANRTAVGAWEQFEILVRGRLADSSISLRAPNRQYMTVTRSGAVFANSTRAGRLETFRLIGV